jgi:hypothetical protein
MTLWDELGAHGGAFAQLAEMREHWTKEDLARELYFHGFARTAEAFVDFKTRVAADLRALGQDEGSHDAFGDAVVLDRLRQALIVLDELDAGFVLRERARLAAHEADRQDAAGRPGAAAAAEAEAIAAADAAAAADGPPRREGRGSSPGACL